MLLDTSVWCLFFLLAIRYWNIIVKNLASYIILLSLLVATTLYDSLSSKIEKIDPRTFKGIEGLSIVNKETLYSNIKFSRTNNIVIFLIDSLDTLAFEKTLEVYPELIKVFDGFTLFRENLGTGGLTPQAIPQILSGTIYNKDKHGEFGDFVQNALIGESSMAADALHAGMNVFIDANFWHVQSVNEFQKKYVSINNKNKELSASICQIYFRFFPYCFKYFVYNRINIKNIENNQIEYKNKNIFNHIIVQDRNKIKFNMLIQRLDNIIDDPVFQFIWFFGVHLPYTKENIIETTREYINDLSHFIDMLKKKGLYNKTTLILMADHGMVDHRKFYPERRGVLPTIFFPLLMIKSRNDTNYQIKDNLTSSAYMRDIIKQFYLNGDMHKLLDSYVNQIPSQRYIFRPGLGTFKATGTFNSLSLHRLDKVNDNVLYDNVLYSFNKNESDIHYGYHDIYIDDNDAYKTSVIQRAFGGFSLRNVILFNRHVKFLYGGSPNSQKKLTFQISSFTKDAAIDIYDKISGNKVRWTDNGSIEIVCSVDNNGFINLIFSPVVNRSTIIHYMVIQDINEPPPEFPPLHN